jgi:hypothetical protein
VTTILHFGPQPDVTVIMPVCSWPDPDDVLGDPHPHLKDSLRSVTAALHAPGLPRPNVELLLGVDGARPKVIDALYDWMAEEPEVAARIYQCDKAPVQTWGNRQRNILLNLMAPTGRLIVWQDQDDSFFEGALARVVSVASKSPGHPVIFRMQVCADKNGTAPFVLWKEKGRIERNHIGGHMLVVPNDPHLIGRWLPEDSYAADFDFVESTIQAFAASGREPHWSEEFISILRPYAMR